MSESGQRSRRVRRGRTQGIGPISETRAGDRRVEKTEALLRKALGELIHEKPYEEIVVKESLHRANVGQSTFYTRFRDKDDLLLSCIHEVLRSARPSASADPHEGVIWFSRPIFEHIEGLRRAGRPVGPGGRRALHERLRRAVAELIEDEVGAALRRSGGAARAGSPDLLVRWIASTFVLVLDWWAESESPIPAREADRVFRSLIEPSLVQALG